ncbi:hypothetical protein J2X69_001564 [Algoriphagus sp. 4150]|nr:hypothetical protein [Algoriphagus sp. 4150]
MIIGNDASSHISLVLLDRQVTRRSGLAEVAAPLAFSEYYDTFLLLLAEKRQLEIPVYENRPGFCFEGKTINPPSFQPHFL